MFTTKPTTDKTARVFEGQINRQRKIADRIRQKCGGLPGISDGDIHDAVRRLAGREDKVIERFSKISCGPDLAARSFKETFLKSERPTLHLKKGKLHIK